MRLTLLSKLLITLIVISAVGLAIFRWRGQLTATFGGASPVDSGSSAAGVASGSAASGSTPWGAAAGAAKGSPSGRRRVVVGVNDFGGAYPGVVANDGATPGPNSLFTKAGLDVELRLVPGSKERLEQFDAGGIDVMLLTLDYLANLYPEYHAKGTEVQAFLFVDWSRGNLGLVAKPSFTSIESLKTARIVTTRNTPTHYFLLTLFDRSNLSAADVTTIKDSLIFAKKTPQAGEIFQRGEADAVAIWEPHLSKAVSEGKGRLLVSTSTATNLIADVLFARATFLDANTDIMPRFVSAWLEGVRRLREDRAGAVAIVARAFSQAPSEVESVLSKIKPATFADNRAFFGLETETSPYATLFAEAAEIWKREKVIQDVPEPRKAVRTKFLESVASSHAGEKLVEDFTYTADKAQADALLTKSISIYFASGSSELDPNTRRTLDGFAQRVIAVFQNAYVRVEGNTDSSGARAANVDLSRKRAQSVVDYLVQRHGFDRGRFVAVGNGPDRPVADNKTEAGREWNRRTDFRVVPNN